MVCEDLVFKKCQTWDTSSILTGPTLISSLSASETNANNKALYIATHTHSSEVDSITTNYRLRAWIDYNVDSSSWSETNKYEYKFRININGVVEYKQPTPEYCFEYTTDDTTMTASITNYLCYEGNEYGYEAITDLYIPSILGGYNVTEINEGGYFIDPLFKGLTSVVLPNTLQIIGGGTFCNNPNLTGTLVIPNSVISIGYSAFNQTNFTSLTLGESIQTIGGYAFCSNINLTGDLAIPDSVTTIGEFAFSWNNLTGLILGNSVQTIGEGAFYSNINLTGDLAIPDSATSIGSSAFDRNNLTSVIIGENSNLTETTGIGSEAFASYTFSGTSTTYTSNPDLTIYNNSGKAFKWINAINGSDSTTTFITDTVPSYISGNYTHNEVLVTTGYPE